MGPDELTVPSLSTATTGYGFTLLAAHGPYNLAFVFSLPLVL